MTSIRKIRVLIVDDSVVVRKILTEVIASDPGLEVVGTAANGSIAVQRIEQLNPDVVTLDVEMPDVDGLQALGMIRKTHPKLPVIMFSSLTERGAVATLQALALGASDYVTKPAGMNNPEQASAHISTVLIPKIKALCSRAVGLSMPNEVAPSQPIQMPPASPSPARTTQRIDVLAIAISTGGPNALAALLPALGADFPVPILIVQHMPPMFTKFLSEHLQLKTALMVREGKAGEILKWGHVWIAPGDYHMTVVRKGAEFALSLNQDPPINSCRPAGDALFRSVAEHFGPRALALVMTGMGQDGMEGCRRIREQGGSVWVQDQQSSVVWGMPGFVANAGLADNVLPLKDLAAALRIRAFEGRKPSILPVKRA